MCVCVCTTIGQVYSVFRFAFYSDSQLSNSHRSDSQQSRHIQDRKDKCIFIRYSISTFIARFYTTVIWRWSHCAHTPDQIFRMAKVYPLVRSLFFHCSHLPPIAAFGSVFEMNSHFTSVARVAHTHSHIIHTHTNVEVLVFVPHLP